MLAAAGKNGPGVGMLMASPAGLAWQAPGSDLAGQPQAVSPDGSYLLLDGVNPSCWVRVQIFNEYLPSSGAANVYLEDAYNALGTSGPGDVSASEAAAGQVVTTTYTLENVSGNAVYNVTLWLDNSTVDLLVSSDGTNFYAPMSQGDPNVITYAAIAVGASANLYLKRTIAAGAASNPEVLNVLEYAWTGH